MKRIFDLLLAIPGVIVLAPAMLLIAIAVKLDTPGPVLFRQLRVGRYGVPFRVSKFRTMTADAENRGPSITSAGDARITRTGRWLRKSKLDELPQLLNVIVGQMSLVGPRPEVPRYVALYPEERRKIVLSVRPGITDNASIKFRHEDALLAAAADAEARYIDEILPQKIKMYECYVRNQSLYLDVKILFATLVALIRRE